MIRAEGAAAAGERLEDVAEAIRQNLAAAVASEAEALQAEARRRCPVETGRLRDSIRAGVRTQNADVDASVGSNLDYAKHLELGTLSRPPAPYLAPALKARKGALIESVRKAIHSALKESIK